MKTKRGKDVFAQYGPAALSLNCAPRGRVEPGIQPQRAAAEVTPGCWGP